MELSGQLHAPTASTPEAGWKQRKICDGYFHDLYSSLSNVRIVKWSQLLWTGYLTGVKEDRKTNLKETSREMQQYMEENTEIDVIETECKYVNFSGMT